jgi:hypothetical protein
MILPVLALGLAWVRKLRDAGADRSESAPGGPSLPTSPAVTPSGTHRIEKDGWLSR